MGQKLTYPHDLRRDTTAQPTSIQTILQGQSRNLSSDGVEVIILERVFENKTYDEIAQVAHYPVHYLQGDVGASEDENS
jgi:hypothetical protein